MRIAGKLAGFVMAICYVGQAGAIQNAIEAGRGAASAPLDLSHEIRPFPRPPVIINATPPTPLPNNVASSQMQQARRAVCSGKPAECAERRKIAEPRPAS